MARIRVGMILKLPALGARPFARAHGSELVEELFGMVVSFIIVRLHPALKGGDCMVLSVHATSVCGCTTMLSVGHPALTWRSSSRKGPFCKE